jgi:hypothetical protein
MCNRALLIAGVNKLQPRDIVNITGTEARIQVQLIHQSLEEYVDAWR